MKPAYNSLRNKILIIFYISNNKQMQQIHIESVSQFRIGRSRIENWFKYPHRNNKLPICTQHLVARPSQTTRTSQLLHPPQLTMMAPSIDRTAPGHLHGRKAIQWSDTRRKPRLNSCSSGVCIIGRSKKTVPTSNIGSGPTL